jgi:hypothetical protein
MITNEIELEIQSLKQKCQSALEEALHYTDIAQECSLQIMDLEEAKKMLEEKKPEESNVHKDNQ